MSNIIASVLERGGHLVMAVGAAMLATAVVMSSRPPACVTPEVGQIVADRLTGKRLMVRSAYGRPCVVVARDERGRLLSFHVAELEF
mgnify:CR=1 FL=1